MFKEGDTLKSDTNTGYSGYWKVIRVNKTTYVLRVYDKRHNPVIEDFTKRPLDYTKSMKWVNAHMSVKEF